MNRERGGWVADTSIIFKLTAIKAAGTALTVAVTVFNLARATRAAVRISQGDRFP
jgi:hypothetical protein